MPTPPIIVAHRGASADAPENTKAAFVLAWIQGADAIEGDFRMTKDRQIVCIHDATTARTTNRKRVVARTPLSALQQLDAGNWKSRQWGGQRIPTLEEVLSDLPDGKQLYLEIKVGVEILEPLKALLEQSPANKDRVVLQSFAPEVVKAARPLFPGFKILLLVNRTHTAVGEPWIPTAKEIADTAREAGADGVNCCGAGFLKDRDCAAQLTAAGLELHAWRVNRGSSALTLAQMGVISVTTGSPGLVRRQMTK